MNVTEMKESDLDIVVELENNVLNNLGIKNSACMSFRKIHLVPVIF